VRFSFEATSLRQAVAAAGILRRTFPYGVRVRPAQVSRHGAYEWAIAVTTGPIHAGLISTVEEEMRWVARRAIGVRFSGWLCLSSPVRVLIVDGSAPFRGAARNLLEAEGHQVVGEADGAAPGLIAYDRLRPDAVLADVRLPDGSGLDLCEVLTGERDAPTVLLLASDDATDAERARECGASDLVSKEDLARVDLQAVWAKCAG
jgi:CheY-like chemotaxis protein